MTSNQLRIKTGAHWFPALMQWRTAMTQLSDGAFKLFVYLCLNADRTTAQLEFRQTTLARTLGKSRRSLITYLQELKHRQICSVNMSSNQHAAGTIQIQALYWPYEWAPQESDSASTAENQDSYVQAIREYLQSRVCVRCRFSALDRQLAQEWFRQGVELWRVEQAVFIACGRKYVSWLNGADFQPIGSLRYFEPVLGEVLQQKVSAEYWDFNRAQLKKLELRWLTSDGSSPAAAGEDPSKGAPSTVHAQTLLKQNAETR